MRVLRIKIPRIPKSVFSHHMIASVIFLIMIFLLPFTKLSVPSLGKYEFTISDALLVVLAIYFLMQDILLSKVFSKYIYTFLFFFFCSSINIVVVKSSMSWTYGIFPYLFAFIHIYVVFAFFSQHNKLKTFNLLWWVLFISLFISALPVYFQIFTGYKNLIFWDRVGWRYTFLAINPNQFGVYLILFFFILTMITLKFFRKRLMPIIFLKLFFIIPVLFSGSKTALFAVSLNLAILILILFLNSSTIKRIIFIPCFVIFGTLMIPLVSTLTEGQGGQIDRAIKIFSLIQNRGTDVLSNKSATAVSIDDGKRLFREHPILGVGLNNKKHYEGNKNEIHNTFIKVLAESGIVGFIGFILILMLPLVYIVFSRTDNIFKLVCILFYSIFGVMNIPHMLFRQRWVWFFMVICFVIATTNHLGKEEHQRLKILN